MIQGTVMTTKPTLYQQLFKETSSKSIDDHLVTEAKAKISEFVGDKPVHWYGLKFRPYDIGTVPKNQNVAIFLPSEQAQAYLHDKNTNNSLRHGAIGYLNELTPENIKSFELVDLAVNSEPTEEEIMTLIAFMADQVLVHHESLALSGVSDLTAEFHENPEEFAIKYLQQSADLLGQQNEESTLKKLHDFVDYVGKDEVSSYEVEQAIMQKISERDSNQSITSTTDTVQKVDFGI